MKNTLLALLGFILLSTPLAATAQQFGDFTYTSDGSAITITGYTGPGGTVTIPASINGLPVTTVGYAAFFNKGSLTSVTIPSSVTFILDKAFGYCMGLTAITVDAANASYSSLDGVLFDKNKTLLIQCPGAKAGTYSIPGSVTSIGSEAFFGCYNLTGVTISGNVNSIGFSSFLECTNLTSVAIPGSVTSIGVQAFDGCSSLTSVTIPGSVSDIGDQAFDLCSSLTNVTIPGSVTNIGYRVFSGCGSLTSVTIPGSVTTIGREAFQGCFSLASVTMLDGVTSIGDYAFWGCSSLRAVVIPGSVASFGLSAFQDCTSLTNVTIPGNVPDIGQFTFENCRNLQGVFFKGNPPGGYLDPFLGATNATVYYLPGTTGWGATFAGRPAVLWNPLMQSSGVGPAGFGFNITGTTNIPIVVEATTNLANATWVQLQSLNLTNGAFYFSDPSWTNYPARSYRIRSP
jgi:hypothetical protein